MARPQHVLQPARPAHRRPATPPDGPDSLVRRLIEASGGPPGTPPPGVSRDDGSRVVLDVCVDDYRCVLIRQFQELPAATNTLSPREAEIARMVAKGLPNKTIARVLEISVWTVSTYLRRIFAKLGVCSRAAMVAELLKDSTFAVPAVGSPSRNGVPL